MTIEILLNEVKYSTELFKINVHGNIYELGRAEVEEEFSKLSMVMRKNSRIGENFSYVNYVVKV
jgi:hypothetical protein